MMMTICSIIVRGFEVLMIYALFCGLDTALAERYEEPTAKWNKLSKFIK